MSLRTAKPLEAWGKKCLVGREGKLSYHFTILIVVFLSYALGLLHALVSVSCSDVMMRAKQTSK